VNTPARRIYTVVLRVREMKVGFEFESQRFSPSTPTCVEAINRKIALYQSALDRPSLSTSTLRWRWQKRRGLCNQAHLSQLCRDPPATTTTEHPFSCLCVYRAMVFDIFSVTLRLLLASLFWKEDALQARTPLLSFHLRHQHAVTNTSRVIFSDVGPSQLLSHSLSTPADPYTYDVDTSRLLTYRPSSYAAFHDARLRSMLHGQNDGTLWHPDEVLGPDVTDRETLLSLAKMSNNAYTAVPDAGWYKVDGFNTASQNFPPSKVF
jgi:hypothetical protein